MAHLKIYRYAVLLLTILLASTVMSGCGDMIAAAFAPADTSTPTLTFTPTQTATLTLTPTPTLTPTSTLTPTPTWIFQSGKIVCPILLYHRIDMPPDSKSGGARYYVTPENFEQQMNALKDWGYNAIPISLLVKAITKGTELPLHPVVITFDDGDVSVFKNAFPIMKRFGFVGVVYIVGNRLEADGFMHPDQIKKLASRGWEVGSHSMTHTDLTFDHEALRHELADSKRLLEEKVGVHVDSFAYPFATIDPVTAQKAYEIGYTNAVGVGTFYTNDKYVLYYLNRLEIRYDYTLEKIASILPWPGAPTATPTP
jgi:peptidoglycan/xylan/chitin deacetylase (PgdA/CDA1 family)